MIFLGIFVLSPLVAKPVTNLLGMLLERLMGTSGKLARRNAMRSPRRTAATAAAVMISITLVALASTLTGSIRGTIDDVLANDVEAEVIVRPSGQFGDPTQGFTSEIAGRVEQLDEVQDLTRIHAGWARLVSETEVSHGETRVDVDEGFITGAEPNLADFIPPDDFRGKLRPGPGELIIDAAIAGGLELGDTLTIEFEQTGERSFPVVGIVEGRAWAGIVAIPSDDWISAYGVDQHSQVYVKAAEGVTADQLKAAVEPLLADYPNVVVQTFEDLQSEAESQLNGPAQLHPRATGPGRGNRDARGHQHHGPVGVRTHARDRSPPGSGSRPPHHQMDGPIGGLDRLGVRGAHGGRTGHLLRLGADRGTRGSRVLELRDPLAA